MIKNKNTNNGLKQSLYLCILPHPQILSHRIQQVIYNLNKGKIKSLPGKMSMYV